MLQKQTVKTKSCGSSMVVLCEQSTWRATWTRRFTTWRQWLCTTGRRTVKCVPWLSRSMRWRWLKHICLVRRWSRLVDSLHWRMG